MPNSARRLARHEALLLHERELWASGAKIIAGLDEVGTGPWAGPLFASCVVLGPTQLEGLVGVDDSKRLSPERRTALAEAIRAHSIAWAVAEISVDEIDASNVLIASVRAMERALVEVESRLGPVDALLVDAHELPVVRRTQRALVKGDATSLSIAAASILAKVARDAVMEELGRRYPGYGFEHHKGYGTAEHRAAIERLGLTPLHRRSFAPVKAIAVPLDAPHQLTLF